MQCRFRPCSPCGFKSFEKTAAGTERYICSVHTHVVYRYIY